MRGDLEPRGLSGGVFPMESTEWAWRTCRGGGGKPSRSRESDLIDGSSWPFSRFSFVLLVFPIFLPLLFTTMQLYSWTMIVRRMPVDFLVIFYYYYFFFFLPAGGEREKEWDFMERKRERLDSLEEG